MRIALLHTRYARSGGVEKYISGLADRLLLAGHEVHYFSRPPSREGGVPPGLVLHPVPFPRWPEAAKPLAYAHLAALAVRRAERRAPFDVVHGFSSTFAQDVYTEGSGAAADLAALLGSAAPSPLRRALWYWSPRRLAARHLEQRRYRAPGLKRVLAMSELVRRQLLRRHPLPPERIEVLHPPVDAVEFSPERLAGLRQGARARLGAGAGDRVLLFIGNGFARKGLDLLIGALARAGKAGWTLWAAGRDRRGRAFERRARTAGIEARFLGYEADTASLYAAADAFALPSRFDAFGAAALEAMAAGLAVVVSSRAGASEVVEDGRSGLVLKDPEDPRELAGRLEALADPGLRQRLGEGARAAAARLTWESHLAGVQAAYRASADGAG